MIDVFEKIKPLLVFESDDDFYYLQILQRKKENPQLGSNSRVIKNYYIGSVEYLEERYDEIKALCAQFNARAMLRMNKRSYEKVAFKTMQNLANSIANGEYKFVRKSYDRACGNGHNDKYKTWILDIDERLYPHQQNSLVEEIEALRPDGVNKFVTWLPTKNGFHLITRPFDLQEFKRNHPDIEIHKDNPINLYIP